MLCSMFRGGHFKHVGDAEQRFLSVSISYHLKNKKKLEINNKKKNIEPAICDVDEYYYT